ncbi:MAG TPA: hypothetical protein DD364_04150 [Ruminococcaceae bacterium]|nr:hypothetical protein [Oscillospiraceae bacterium]
MNNTEKGLKKSVRTLSATAVTVCLHTLTHSDAVSSVQAC